MKSARRIVLIAMAGLIASGSTACSRISMPTLETAACTEARDVAKRFYSSHFGASLVPSLDDLKKKEAMITPSLYRNLESRTESAEDYFTATADYPKAFRIGSCELRSEEKAVIQILLFWRDEQRSEQREIQATLIKSDGKWLIDEVGAR